MSARRKFDAEPRERVVRMYHEHLALFATAELDRRLSEIVAHIDAHIDAHKVRFGVEQICRVLTEHGTTIVRDAFRVAGF